MNVSRDSRKALQSARKYLSKACDINKQLKTLVIVIDGKGHVAAQSNNTVFDNWISDTSPGGMNACLANLFGGHHQTGHHQTGHHQTHSLSSFQTVFEKVQ